MNYIMHMYKSIWKRLGQFLPCRLVSFVTEPSLFLVLNWNNHQDFNRNHFQSNHFHKIIHQYVLEFVTISVLPLCSLSTLRKYYCRRTYTADLPLRKFPLSALIRCFAFPLRREKIPIFAPLPLSSHWQLSLSLSHSHSRMVSKHQLSLGRIETRVQERAVPRGRKCVSSSSSFSLSSSPGPHFLVCFPGKGTRAQIRARARLFQPLSPRSNGDPPNNVVWNDARASPNSKSYLHF